MVYAIVTLPKSGNGSRRLLFCTKTPEEITLDYRDCADDAIREYGKEDIRYLLLACYMLRWDIEVSYYVTSSPANRKLLIVFICDNNA